MLHSTYLQSLLFPLILFTFHTFHFQPQQTNISTNKAYIHHVVLQQDDQGVRGDDEER